jgi:hypothetical protein
MHQPFRLPLLVYALYRRERGFRRRSGVRRVRYPRNLYFVIRNHKASAA